MNRRTDSTLSRQRISTEVKHQQQDPASTQFTYRQAIILFALALIIRLVHFLAMRDTLLFQALICDCSQYDRWAQRIAGGEWIGTEVFYQTPLYPYLLAVIYRICGHSIWAVRFVQAVFGALATVALARAGARFFSERVGWVAGILLALYPPAIFFDGILQKASLDLLLMTVLLWTLGRAQDEPRAKWFVLIGGLEGAMTLNRENSAALLPVLLAWIVWLSWGNVLRAGAARVGLFLAGLALVLLPVGARNYHVGGAFLLTTSQMGPNFYIGNHRGASGGYVPMRAGRGEPGFEAEDARLLAEDDLKRPLKPREVSQYWMRRTWSDIKSAPSAWLRLLATKWWLTWHAIEMVDAEAIHTHERHSPLLRGLNHVLHFGVLCPLAVFGIVFTRHDWRRLWILYAMLLAFALAVTAFYVFARYRYPLVPVVTLFAAAGLTGLWEWLRCQFGDGRATQASPPHPALSCEGRGFNTSRWELAVGLALAGAVAVAGNWPLSQPFNDDAITYYNAGSSLMGVGRTDDALALLQLAADTDPRFPDTYNNLGQIQLARGDLPAARRAFEHGLQADPQYALFYVNLANVLIKQGDSRGARPLLEKAVELDPLLAPAYGPLAELEYRAGDAAAALRHLRRAVELQPASAVARTDLAMVLAAQQDWAGAVQELRAVLAIDSSMLVAANRLAWLLATAGDDRVRNGAEAVQLAEQLCRATGYKEAALLDTLAAAQAESGQFEKAVATIAEAEVLARAAGNADLAGTLAQRRQRYAEGKPYREPRASAR